MFISILGYSLVLGLVSSAPVTLSLLGTSSTTNLAVTYNFTIVNSTSNIVNITMNLNNYNVSQWTSKTANNGLYVGLGFNVTEMDWADIIRCQYVFTNATTDKFNCTEFYYKPDPNESLPGSFVINSIQNF